MCCVSCGGGIRRGGFFLFLGDVTSTLFCRSSTTCAVAYMDNSVVLRDRARGNMAIVAAAMR